jgi:hypothetical protein
MELLIEFGKIVLPAMAVMYAMYLTIKMFIQKDWESKKLELSKKNTEIVLPVRMQAYERMCLFLERISPNNLIMRLNDSNYTAGQFQQVLVGEIRQEFNHNLSQQVYMSNESWNMVKNAMEDIILVINKAAGNVQSDEKSIELARKIFELMMDKDQDKVNQALIFIKNEIRLEF